MGKRKKQIAREHKEAKKAAEEERTALDGAHRLLMWLKIVLAMSMAGNLFFILHDGISGNDLYDLIANAVFLVLIAGSIWFHERKKGVYLFFAYGIIELLYEYLISFLAWKNGVFAETVGSRLFEYTFFTAIILIPLYFYYRKRMQYLQS